MEVDKSFINILVSPQYNVYKEVIVMINKKQYLVKYLWRMLKPILVLKTKYVID